ncbi:MAG: hypothetical protein BWK73_32340 [Thiothrix lacustris]|uniref:DNA methylase adenine-specific domain-containing protein n=1 Tax=Thiothrix lacustris TaxID=525917 RepID=A0A1Y1QHJ4_9GAMM|nr:MAG: hypothetical protein BWK73_32340 [Thiothrix lacustris]
MRESLVKTGHVDVMIDIRGNFFYTRTVPCQLWFFDKAKPAHLRDKVLMLDARHVYRKVTRKIYDFSPEQQQNLTAVVWLYRGENERFVELVQEYVERCLEAAKGCKVAEAISAEPIPDVIAAFLELDTAVALFVKDLELKAGEDAAAVRAYYEFWNAVGLVRDGWAGLQQLTADLQKWWNQYPFETAEQLLSFVSEDVCLRNLADASRDLVKDIDLAYKLATRVLDECEAAGAKDSALWDGAVISGSRRTSLKKVADEARQVAIEQLKQVRYGYKQAHWLLSRFPEGKYRDVEGLVKLVDVAALAAADWSLTPGRYVGVAAKEVDEDFDFEETLRDIHIELDGLNQEAVTLAAQIAQNFKGLGL